VRSDSDVLADLTAAFEHTLKPAQFWNPQHCDECAEYEALLQARDRNTLRLEDIANPAWDPFAGASPEGLAYYLPTLARFTLETADGASDWYGEQLLFHLTSGGSYNAFIGMCSHTQAAALARFLEHLIETSPALLEPWADEVFRLIERLRQNSA
jgi:hypothetical protein